MNCSEFDGLLADQAEGDLAPARLLAFYLHLSVCPGCVSWLGAYYEVVRLLRAERKRQ